MLDKRKAQNKTEMMINLEYLMINTENFLLKEPYLLKSFDSLKLKRFAKNFNLEIENY